MNPRRVAFDVLRAVTGQGAYSNLALAEQLAGAQLAQRDAGLATELVAGTCRGLGTYDQIIERASGRRLASLQPAVIDLLRLGCHQLLSMQVKGHAAVATTVELARQTVGNRVTGLVNAVLRKVSAQSMEQWLTELTRGQDQITAMAIRGSHPRWIVEEYAKVLPPSELAAALKANNDAPQPTLVVRPGLATVDQLQHASATAYSPYGATSTLIPSAQPLVREGHAGVQDEGSQLVAIALTRPPAPDGPWLDLCAGPGGKAALLAGLARKHGHWMLASELQPHRARLVAKALSVYPDSVTVITADGTTPAWSRGFARVMADVPCSGLGALRRRPEARWRRQPSDVTAMAEVQRDLLASAINSAMPGGVVAYVTCSPLAAETVEVVDEVLACYPEVTRLDAAEYLPPMGGVALGRDVQLWPHRHGTDAMYLSLLRIGGG